MALERVKVASSMICQLYPQYSFYRRLSGPQNQSGHKGVKRNLLPSNTRDKTWAIQPVAQRFLLELPGPLPFQGNYSIRGQNEKALKRLLRA